MEPISAIPVSDLRNVRFVLADIDDTMTVDGRLPAESYRALWSLHNAGIGVIPVTGRPAGWCDLISRQWPVCGVVGENGAFAFYLDGRHRRALYHPDAPRPEENRVRLEATARRVYDTIPGTRPAKDQFSRLFDVAIDFREEPPLLGYDVAERIKAVFEDSGARAKVSSIHVNAWYGSYDKLSMARHFLTERFALDIDDAAANRSVLFCGDSPNDEPMFGAFRLSVAVANIEPFLAALSSPPTYVCARESAGGFVDLVELVLESRRATHEKPTAGA